MKRYKLYERLEQHLLLFFFAAKPWKQKTRIHCPARKFIMKTHTFQDAIFFAGGNSTYQMRDIWQAVTSDVYIKRDPG